jgi:DNA-binding response OmpR family regulator
VRRITLGNLVIDRESYEVTVGGEPRHLTFTEFELLWRLASKSGRVVERTEMVRMLRPHRQGPSEAKTLDVHMTRLRRKLEGMSPYQLVTVRKRGYMLADARAMALPEQGAPSGPSAVMG